MISVGLNGYLRGELIAGKKLKIKLSRKFVVGHQGKILLTIPKGFVTDFASIPQPFWNILPPTGRYSESAVVHDYLYATQSCTRKEADDMFLFLMKLLEVSYWKRKVMYTAVRTFGWYAWNEHKQKITRGR